MYFKITVSKISTFNLISHAKITFFQKCQSVTLSVAECPQTEKTVNMKKSTKLHMSKHQKQNSFKKKQILQDIPLWKTRTDKGIVYM